MAVFETGTSGNPRGRPTKADQALKGVSTSDLTAMLRKLKKAAPEAVSLIIAAMGRADLPEKERLKHAKDICDMFVKVLAADANLKKEPKSATDAPSEDDDEEDDVKPVIFRIV